MNGQQLKVRRRENACKEQNWRCYYCGIRMIPPEPSPGCGHTPNPAGATLEHLDDRFSDQRGSMPGIRRVAACWKCNNEQSLKRQAELSKRDLRRRSGRYPRSAPQASHVQELRK